MFNLPPIPKSTMLQIHSIYKKVSNRGNNDNFLLSNILSLQARPHNLTTIKDKVH